MCVNRAHRAFDVVGACAGLIVFAPVMAIISVVILIDDGGPILFRQQCVGYRRRPFDILKFRSMRDAVNAFGNTRVRGWLRRRYATS